MTPKDFLDDFVGTSLWSTLPAKHRFKYTKEPNTGMKESHRLALTMKGVIDRSLDDNEGLQSSDYGSYQIFEPGDLAFKLIDLQNIKTSRVGLVPRRGIMSPAYIRLVPTSDVVVSKFYYWYFYAAYIGNIFNGLGGGIRQNLSQTELLNFPVPDLSQDDQNAIADYLDRETARIDGLIAQKTRFIAVLDDKEKAMIAHFVRRGIDASAPTKDSGVEWRGAVPAHWQRARMKNHFKQVKRQGFDDLTVLSVYREFGVIEKASRSDNINKTPEDLSKYQLVEPNDLAINKMKAWQGSMGISPFLGITSPDYVVMKPVGEHNPRYMHHYLRARPMPWVYRLISNGIRTDQWRMEPEKFLELPIFLPPMDEQEAIANRIDRELDRIRGLIEKTERSIALLKEKRAALITAAVTGKIDVRAAA
ncbi:type I restriction enzyme, S subunit [Aliiroseovarius crassostreae]|uniref:Type I restriction modification DNA specificity domain-containing protein n=1 Tax=Aliiroseovarius crassostreae TaxID=154981 RepID=A0A0P7KHN6_9RHOB|nr:restriction endonuclease subunit S [Aliiroseovarius crassostreae]KPN63016.1 hypothetical protein AKJ29_02375 [Aliiroseovarius crassostreae]SFU67884.1 type I restriction enzyme, S subunit [Aliiroseovarius crassostreae]